MSENILIAILSLLGTLGGSFAGIITSGKLTNFRLSALETKDTVSEEKMKHLDRRVQTLEQHLN